MIINSGNYSAALYIRLSKDDGLLNESSSIATQRKMLLRFAKENAFTIYDTYIDDGFSGTNFDRPAFKRMIQDIEEKKVNLVITKDLSRLGRDYILTGQYTEIYFPINSVRFIAINDGYDSESLQNDIAPFKNVVNEMYARDISKKIKSAFQTKMQDGSFIGNFAPYGYQKDPINKNQLIPDKEAAQIVKLIFSMAEKGSRPKEIADYLNKTGEPSPLTYRYLRQGYSEQNPYRVNKEWTSATLSKILRNTVYLGHLEQGKTTKISIKSKTNLPVPKAKRIMVYHTHEPLISEDTYQLVQKFFGTRKNPKNTNLINIFSGIALCLDCGKNMSTTGRKKDGVSANLTCGRYKLYGRKGCSNHFINYQTLYEIIKMELQRQIHITEEEKNEILHKAAEKMKKPADKSQPGKKRLAAAQARAMELDKIIKKLYEDNVSGLLTAERFKKLMDSYEKEQKEVKAEINELSEEVKNWETDYDIGFYEELLMKYTNITELTPDILNKWIEKIEIGQGYFDKMPGISVKKQEIKIHYRFSGQDTTMTFSYERPGI